jgi:hypothetical protein
VVVVTDDPSDHVVVDRSPSDVFVEVNTDVDDCASAGVTPTTALIKRPATNFISASPMLHKRGHRHTQKLINVRPIESEVTEYLKEAVTTQARAVTLQSLERSASMAAISSVAMVCRPGRLQ